MFSNVLRNIDWKLLQQQKDSLTQLITEEKLPLNHPLVGLLGLVSGILIERVAGQNRVDVSMNYWWQKQENDLPRMCINFHPSVYSFSWATRMAVVSGLLISLLSSQDVHWEEQQTNEQTLHDIIEQVMEKMTLVRFGELEDRDAEE